MRGVSRGPGVGSRVPHSLGFGGMKGRVRQLRGRAEQPVRGPAGVGRDNGLTHPGKAFFHIEGSVE